MTAPQEPSKAVSTLEAYIESMERTLLVSALFEDTTNWVRKRVTIRMDNSDEWPRIHE